MTDEFESIESSLGEPGTELTPVEAGPETETDHARPKISGPEHAEPSSVEDVLVVCHTCRSHTPIGSPCTTCRTDLRGDEAPSAPTSSGFGSSFSWGRSEPRKPTEARRTEGLRGRRKHAKAAASIPVEEPPAIPEPEPVAAPEITSLTADRELLLRGDGVVVRWTSTDADAATLSGVGTVAPSGEVTVSPTSTGTLVLTVSGIGGATTSETRSIMVIDEIPIRPMIVPVPSLDLTIAIPTMSVPRVDLHGIDLRHIDSVDLRHPIYPELPELPELPAMPAGHRGLSSLKVDGV
jgi:hypothetical protein